MNKASPRVLVPDWAKTNVTAAETAPAVETDFVNISTQAFIKNGGMLQPSQVISAKIPDWEKYERGRISFAPVTLNSGTLTVLTLSAYAYHRGQDAVSVVGRSEVAANLQDLPVIEFDVRPGEIYSVIVSDIDGTAPDVSIASVWVEGFYTKD